MFRIFKIMKCLFYKLESIKELIVIIYKYINMFICIIYDDIL